MKPKLGTLLWRGLQKRCGVCGGGRTFDSWFRMKPTCPTCGIRFEREAGFFGGALFVNFAFTEIVMFTFLAVATVATLPRPNGRLLILGSVGICIVLPVLLYPFSKTTWFAIHLAMEPLEPDEEAEAAVVRIERGDLGAD
jgi:uncharacterized protein (DUF983 family)